MVLNILNNVVNDSVIVNFTYSGDSKLDKTHKMTTDFKNICSMIYAVFVYADSVKKYELPPLSKVNKALSSSVRHASERLERAEKNRIKNLEKKEKTAALNNQQNTK